MTTLNLLGAETALGGYAPLRRGTITVSYRTARGGYVEIDGKRVVLPRPITVSIVNGQPTSVLELAPTRGYSAAQITIAGDGINPYTRFYAIPDLPSVDFGDLVEVDISTFEATDETIEAWLAAIGEVEAIRVAAVEDLEGIRTVTIEEVDAIRTDVQATAAQVDADADSAAGSAAAAQGSAIAAASSASAAAANASDSDASADAAQASADSAAGSASDAASSATSAGLSATSAASSAADASTSREGAETARTGAETARSGSETARTGAEAAQAGAETARTGAEAARDVSLAGQFLGTPLTSGADLNNVTTPGVYRVPSFGVLNTPGDMLGVMRVYARDQTNRFIQEFVRQSGNSNLDTRGTWTRSNHSLGWTPWRFTPSQRINSPAGQPGAEVFTWDDVNNREQALLAIGTSLGTVDLNSVTVPGHYWQGNVGNATAARNYPAPGNNGALEVLQMSTALIQRFVVHSGSATAAGRLAYQRSLSSGTWSAWRTVSTQRVDQTAGRAIYTWDDVNNREQLIYGDTGKRELTNADLLNGFTAARAYLRRVGSEVTLDMTGVARASDSTSNHFIQMPVGFRPGGSDPTFGIAIRSASNEVTQLGTSQGRLFGGPLPGASGWITMARFRTEDPWPTTLPGNAVGSIPA
uniref:Minor tail protein n=1 Tax=Microbacterium phage Sunny TaxID=3144828 RepID=A0AAU7J7X0_9VIRU